MATEPMNKPIGPVGLANQLGLPQPELFMEWGEVVADVRNRLEVARIDAQWRAANRHVELSTKAADKMQVLDDRIAVLEAVVAVARNQPNPTSELREMLTALDALPEPEDQ